jgi:hypothetical protein
MYSVWMGSRNVPDVNRAKERIVGRIVAASILGILGFGFYVVLAVTLADRLVQWHWAARAIYFAIAGVLWVIPARWLMIWAARR